MSADTKRRLEHLPEYADDLSAWRDWLTAALCPADGFRVEDFIRHGRQRIDGCDLVLNGSGGQRLSFAIEEQRLLSTPASQRPTLVAATDGLVRPGSLTRPEQEDVWIALVTLATVTANQDARSEARDWLVQVERAAEPMYGATLQPVGRLDALVKLGWRELFDRPRALDFADPKTKPEDKPRPVMLVDSQTGEHWMRVSEVACFLRHVLGATPMAYPTLDGRLSAIGVGRVDFAQRRGTTYGRARLYRLPNDTGEDIPDEETST